MSKDGLARVTINDVARRAGVSTTSVSRALNLPRSQTRLSVDTHQQILDAARELGYRPSWSAQSLAKGRTGNIGVLFVGGNPLTIPAFSHLNHALSQTLRQHHYRLMLVPVDAAEGDDDWRTVLEQGRVDGCVIATPGLPTEVTDCLLERRIPTILMNLDFDLPMPRIVADDADGIRQATQHLIDLGHQRIAYLHNPKPLPRPSTVIRREGFLQTMQDAGLAAHAWQFFGEASHFVSEMLERQQRPTAVVCYSHAEACELYHALWQVDLVVPRDVSVIAFNNLYPTEVMQPPLTVMALPFAEIGQLAAEGIVQLLKKPSDDSIDSPMPMRTLLPQQMILRHSTAAPLINE